MKKISECLVSSNYVIDQLAYYPKKYEGTQSAKAAKETLLAELNEIELRMNELESSSFKDLILLTLKKLKVSLQEINIHIDYEDCLLNLILQEYFIITREKFRNQLIEIENNK